MNFFSNRFLQVLIGYVMIELKKEIADLIYSIDHSGHPSRMMPTMLFNLKSSLEDLLESIVEGTASAEDILSLKLGFSRIVMESGSFQDSPVGRKLLDFCKLTKAEEELFSKIYRTL